MTMAATSPTDSVWTQKSMRCFSYSHCRRHRIQDLAGFQIKATASLLSHCLSSSSCCAAHSSSCCAGWLLCVSSLDAPPSRHLVILSLVVPAGCRIIISRRPLVALPSSCPLIVLGTTTARGSRASGGTTTATGGTTIARGGTAMARGSRATGGRTTAMGSMTMTRGSRARQAARQRQ